MKPTRSIAAVCTVAFLLAGTRGARAQEPPPLPFIVADVHGTLVNFPADPLLASSRGLTDAELPGRGLGANVAVHVFPFELGPVTFGLGGRFTVSRARRSAPPATALRSVTERFTYLGPQLSFNFGTGEGWSYLSGGIAGSTWSIVPDGASPRPSDEERLRTIDYGGGARWFARPHIAFSFDVRFYAVNPGSPVAGLPGSPRTTFVVFGAGISLK